MKSFRSILILCLFGALLSCGSTPSEGKKDHLRIAVAANMQFAMDSIVKCFEDETKIECELTSNSSGMLTAQIESGAPFDVFLSANMAYPERLVKNGFGEELEVYALGRLVCVYKDFKYFSIEELVKSPSIKRIAIADVETAPYGMATKEFLEKHGLFDQLKDKIVYGESIAQVNQYLITGAVDAAFTSYSFLTKYGSEFNRFEVAPSEHAPIEQGMLILKHGKVNHLEASEEFVAFIKSKRCKAILKHFGYTVN